MSLNSIGLLAGATLAASSGTAFTLTPMADNTLGGFRVADASVADFRLRPTATFKASIPAFQRDGSFSKDRRNVSFATPLFDSVSGEYQNGVIRVERIAPAFATAAQLLHLNYVAAQLLFDADAVAFWAAGTYA